MLEETAKQKDQSIIWDHFQDEGIESFSQSLPRLRFLVARVKAEAMLLNIGIGGAILERLAIEKGIDIHSLDPNNRAVEKLRAQFMLGEKAKKGTSQNIPFAAGTFDAVVMSEVLEHLTENEFDATLSEVDSSTTAQSVEVSEGRQNRIGFIGSDGYVESPILMLEGTPFSGKIVYDVGEGRITPEGLIVQGKMLLNSSALTAAE